MIVLGLDLGLRTGFALLDTDREESPAALPSYGSYSLDTPTPEYPGGKTDLVRRGVQESVRLRRFRSWARTILVHADRFGGVGMLALELRMDFGKGGAQSKLWHYALRAVATLEVLPETPVVSFYPATLKKRVGGHSKADKPAMVAAVNQAFGLHLHESEHDTADAIAAARCAAEDWRAKRS